MHVKVKQFIAEQVAELKAAVGAGWRSMR